MNKSRLRLPEYWPLLAMIFLDLVGFGMVIADVQLRAAGFGAKGWLIGLTLSSMFVVQLIFSPFWGGLADRVGRKPVVVFCTILSAASLLVYGLATSIEWILLSRILAGMAAANVAVAQSWLSRSTAEADRPTVMGHMGAALTAGLVIGPAIGGFLAEHLGNKGVGLVGASCSLIGVLLVAMLSRDQGRTEAEQDEKKLPISVLFKEKRLVALMILSSVAWTALACLEGTFARLLAGQYDKGQSWFGIIFGYESLVGFVVQAFLIKALTKKWSQKTLVFYGLLMQGIGLASMPYYPVFGLIFFGATIYSFGSALFGPSLNAWCANVTPNRLQGTMFGALQSARSFGFIVGPAVGGAMFDWDMGAPYVMAGGVCLIAAFLATRLDSSSPTPAASPNVE
jgi:MFS family permease